MRLLWRHVLHCSSVEHALRVLSNGCQCCTLVAIDAAVVAQAKEATSVRASDAMLSHGSRWWTAAPRHIRQQRGPPWYSHARIDCCGCIVPAVGHEGCVALHIAGAHWTPERKRFLKLICEWKAVPPSAYRYVWTAHYAIGSTEYPA